MTDFDSLAVEAFYWLVFPDYDEPWTMVRAVMEGYDVQG